MDWQPIATAPEGEPVMTKIDDDGREPDPTEVGYEFRKALGMIRRTPGGPRNVQPLIRKGRLWFFTDMSMYVYYTPTHWASMVTE